jgi:hypothetical protein
MQASTSFQRTIYGVVCVPEAAIQNPVRSSPPLSNRRYTWPAAGGAVRAGTAIRVIRGQPGDHPRWKRGGAMSVFMASSATEWPAGASMLRLSVVALLG